MPRKALVNSKQDVLMPPGHPIILLNSNIFNVAAVSVKRSILKTVIIYELHPQQSCTCTSIVCEFLFAFTVMIVYFCLQKQKILAKHIFLWLSNLLNN